MLFMYNRSFPWKGMYIMEIAKRKAFIINFIYFAIILALAVAALKYVLPMTMPFVMGFVIAYFLQRPRNFLADKLGVSRKVVAIVLVLIFYAVIGLLITLIGFKAVGFVSSLVRSLPSLYSSQIEPLILEIFHNLEGWIRQLDPSFVVYLTEAFNKLLSALGDMVSGLSLSAMGSISGFAYALPGGFIKLVLLIISTFFIAADYDQLMGFCLRQMSSHTKKVVLQIKQYVIGTLFVCIRSYALIMSLTFIELSIGLTIIHVENSILIALLIAIFDILPVLGTGGIMIPWVVISAFSGDFTLALGLLLVYVAITVIRNIIEPKIVGSQIGLHPIITLCSMFVGVQLFGVIGLFGFPIGLSLLRYLNENQTIHLYKMEDPKQESLPGESDL